MTEPTKPIDDELKRKVRRIFAYRTHKFPDKKVEIIQPPETQNQRFIVAPYELTVEKVMQLITADRKQLLDRVEQKMPLKDYRPSGYCERDNCYNDAIDKFESVLANLRKELGV